MQTVIHRYPIKETFLYEDSLSYSPTLTYIPTPDAQQGRILQQQYMGIVYSGATHLYIFPSAPYGPSDTSAATIIVGTANGQVENPSSKATLPIPKFVADFPTMGCIIPSFTNTLVGVVLICDADCTVFFTKQDLTVLSLKGKPIITVWREYKLPRLWRFALKPTEDLIKYHISIKQTTIAAPSAYNLPSVEALVKYMHAAARFPFKYTWLREIKKGNFATWPVLTYSNAAKYCSHAVEKIKGLMVQSLQGVQSTKNKTHPSRGINK